MLRRCSHDRTRASLCHEQGNTKKLQNETAMRAGRATIDSLEREAQLGELQYTNTGRGNGTAD